MIAYVEAAWRDSLRAAVLYRYELPHLAFQPLNDAGMFVSRFPIEPLAVEVIGNLPLSLRACDVELEIMPSLRPLRDVWESSMSASCIRLRNAQDWPQTRG
jgi:hypothetical protein